ncbi:NAD-dependent epimerase/dehydratase family protein [Novosphingobium sp. JCM 18896]|uniref:NAD-dependent epimerase/dehydratase family protein n=1 Tax=Novosphingobium sp. JCM 18896 TaxID=2989731 RepID=UPI002221A69B|nr:NAD(P)-dependent oxidoreductase [Novosphingobium sp. JCM 18896]MCW1428954.1 NAD(P)-dependent oxidoreductase [Novosphingobium sp. JCM 18896]
MAGLSGKRVLVTGASGLVAFPVATELAKANEVHALARWSDPEQKRKMEAAGARTVTFDLANPDLSSLPDVDVVINYAVLPQQYAQSYEVNTAATGRLARRYRDAEAFVHGGTGSAYEYQGERALREDDPYGLHASIENYAASKIASEFLLRHVSEDYGLPVTIVRIFSFYGPRGGAITQRIDQVAAGQPVSVYPGVRNVYTPLYEDDYVEKTIAAAGIAKVGAEVVNVGGTEPVTIQEYCTIAGEILGKEPVFVENSKAWPIWGDTTKMVALLGPNKVSVREGVRRVIESRRERLAGAHHVVGEPTE